MSLSKFQVRILLNHFKWDKERLMERLYSDDQEAMFVEAQVSWEEAKQIISPQAKKNVEAHVWKEGENICSTPAFRSFPLSRRSRNRRRRRQ